MLRFGILGAFSRVGGLVLLPVMTRLLSVAEYGAIDVAMVVTALASALFRWKLPAGIARFFKQGDERAAIAPMYSTAIAFIVVSGLGLTAVVLGVASYAPRLQLGRGVTGEILLLGAGIGLVQAIRSLPGMILRLQRQIFRFHAVDLVATVLMVILAPASVILAEAGVRGVLLAQLFAESVAMLIALWTTRRYLTPALSCGELRRALRFSVPMVPGPLLRWLIEQTDRLVLLALMDIQSVALFGAAWRVSKLVSFPLTLFSGAWQPYSMLLLEDPARNEVVRRSLRGFMVGFSILGLCVTGAAPELFSVLLPPEYTAGILALPWLIGTAILRESGSFTRLGVFVAERTSLVTVALGVSAIANAIFSLALVRAFGLAGAAIGSFAASALATVVLGRFSENVSNIRYERRPHLFVGLGFTMTATLVLLAHQMSPPGWSLAVRVLLVLSGLVFIILTGLEPSTRRTLIALLRRRSVKR